MDIGITCIRTFYILDSYDVHAFVKPTYMYRMSYFCTNLHALNLGNCLRHCYCSSSDQGWIQDFEKGEKVGPDNCFKSPKP